MKQFLLLFLMLWSLCTFGQKEVDGKVSAGDSVAITVNYVQPIEFPEIEVLFHAEDVNGFPYWGLTKEDVQAFENGVKCEVVKLRHFSEEEPINIILVLDQSGSMDRNYWEYIENHPELDMDDLMNDTSWYKDLNYPLGDAVNAIKSFIPSFKESKDKIGLISFSDTIYEHLPLGTSKEKFNSTLDSIRPLYSTSFYDAVYEAIQDLKDAKGINVVIALTDGYDNTSSLRPTDLVSSANNNDVNLYCVGLGNVLKDTLQYLADSTNGFFIHTNDSKSLDSVYTLLERRIKAFYLLTYTSDNWSSADVARDFILKFNAEGVKLNGNYAEYELPNEVVNYLKEKENEQLLTYGIIGGSAVLISMLGLGVWFFRRKKKEKIELIRFFPNPGNGIFEISIKFPDKYDVVQVVMTSTNGTEVYAAELENGTHTIDISRYASGLYIVTAVHPDLESANKKYFKR